MPDEVERSTSDSFAQLLAAIGADSPSGARITPEEAAELSTSSTTAAAATTTLIANWNALAANIDEHSNASTPTSRELLRALLTTSADLGQLTDRLVVGNRRLIGGGRSPPTLLNILLRAALRSSNAVKTPKHKTRSLRVSVGVVPRCVRETQPFEIFVYIENLAVRSIARRSRSQFEYSRAKEQRAI